MKVSSWGGMTRAEHDAILHTSDMIADDSITTSKIVNNAITPLKISFPVYEVLQDRLFYESGTKKIIFFIPSKSNINDLFVCELHASSGSVLFKTNAQSLLLNATKTIVSSVDNESSIYDGNPDSAANPHYYVNQNETREMIRWDFGTSATRTVAVKMGVVASYAGEKIEISNDGTNWTTLFEVYYNTLPQICDFSTATFRYLRWIIYNNDSVNRKAAGDFWLHELQVHPELEQYNTFSRTITATTQKEGVCFCYSGDSSLVLSLYLLRKIW